MRKKSHISLASHILNEDSERDYFSHRSSFYFGSILPDIVPSFLTTPHTFEDTFHAFQKRINKFIDSYNDEKGLGLKKSVQLGEIAHYLADYFTFPHNNHFPGNLKQHCHYENKLKFELRAYIKSGQAEEQNDQIQIHRSKEELLDSIARQHQNYCGQLSSVEQDVRIIVKMCVEVVASLEYLTAGQTRLAYQM